MPTGRTVVSTARITQMFADARSLHSLDLERLDAGDIWDAADKA